MHKAMPKFLSKLSRLRMRFEESGGVFKSDEELDQEERNRIADIIKNEPQEYSPEEERIIREGKEFYEKCKENKNFQNIALPDNRIKMKMMSNDDHSLRKPFPTKTCCIVSQPW